MVSNILIGVVALFTAIIDNTLGMGFGTSLTPILLIIGLDPIEVVSTVLFASGVGSGLSAIFHHYFKNADLSMDSKSFKVAVFIGCLGLVGGVVGSSVAIRIPKDWLNLYIGLVITFSGLWVLFNRTTSTKFSWFKVAVIGLVGALNKGLTGGGFGPIVTTGGLISGLKGKASVAIEDLSEMPVNIAGFLVFLLSGNVLDWWIILYASIGAALSAPISASLVHGMDEGTVRSLIGVSSAVIGLATLLKFFLF